MKPRILRVATAPISLKLLLEGQFAFLQQNGFEVLTVSADGPAALHLMNEGISHRVVPMTRKISPFEDLYCLFLLIGIILKFKPTIVHTHTPKAGLLGMIAAWLCRVPLRMHTVAGLPLMAEAGVMRWVLNLTERLTYACSNHIYPNSLGLFRFMQDEFGLKNLNLDNSRSKFSMIGKGSSNGIDTGYFLRTPALQNLAKAIRSRFHVSETEIIFSFVGRVVKDKGIVELTDAFRRLAGHPCRLMLVGSFESELDPLPEETMAFLATDKRVIFAGFQEDVRPWILASDVFVFPSYREGFPNAVMQASCLEVPCIVSDINGSNEIIQRDDTGLVVPPRQIDLLHEAMLRLANDSEKRKEFGRRSRAFVATCFDRKHFWNELLSEYNRLLRSVNFPQ